MLFLQLLQIALRPVVNEGKEEGRATKTDGNADEGQARYSFGEAIGVGEDVCVSVQEREENNVNHSEV
jgi:hypothetical protein